MGQAVERLAREKGYTVSAILKDGSEESRRQIQPGFADVAIEFSEPLAATGNLKVLIRNRTPVVCGTTGWWEALPEITELVNQHKGCLIYGGNFSIGMNLMMRLNRLLAQWMNHFEDYDPWVLEKHHRHKKDAPGGSALMLAKDILQHLDRKNILLPPDQLTSRAPKPEELSLGIIRAAEIVGTHEVGYGNAIETLTIQHQANSRDGFAYGALLAAQWATQHSGVWSFSDLLQKAAG